VAFQDNFFFDGNIAENIAFSASGATRDDIIAASRVAYCAQFIKRFEQATTTSGASGASSSPAANGN
jgi:subfamily B ATP-binding cassette protein MsbA